MALATVIMNGNENPELIEGFLKIADYFKALIIKKDDRFFVTADSILFAFSRSGTISKKSLEKTILGNCITPINHSLT